MKIALLGFGKMGREIDNLVKQGGRHEIVSVSFEGLNGKLDIDGIKNADVVIDFTSPEIVLENIEKVSALGKNMVIGTTGWYAQLDKVTKIIEENKTGLVYGGNFSIGANIFFKIIAYASKLFSKFEGYDVYGFEVHHSGKKDSPSGTALRIAKEIMDNFPAKKTMQEDRLNRQIEKDELHFASIRGGRNPGFHQVVFDSNADVVTFNHQANNRSGFAAGAILATEFINNKKGLFNFEQVFK